MDQNNFILSVPTAAQPADEDGSTDLDANPHASQQEIFDKLRAAVGLSGTASTSGGSGADALSTGIVVHDPFQQLPNPTKPQKDIDDALGTLSEEVWSQLARVDAG